MVPLVLWNKVAGGRRSFLLENIIKTLPENELVPLMED